MRTLPALPSAARAVVNQYRKISMRFSPRVDRIKGRRRRRLGDPFGGRGGQARRCRRDPAERRRPGFFHAPTPSTESAIKALRAGDTHYTDIPGRTPLRAAIARDHAARGGGDVTAQNVIVMGGAQNAFFSAAQCLFAPGDEVIVLEPMYLTYEACLRIAGAELVRVPAGDGFRPDLARIAAAVTPRTRGIVVANPNNPSGVVLNDAELEGLAEIARTHDLWVVSDEVYATMTFDATHRSIAALPGMAERSVTIGSLSKSHAMTGWRCGWLIGPRELAAHVGEADPVHALRPSRLHPGGGHRRLRRGTGCAGRNARGVSRPPRPPAPRTGAGAGTARGEAAGRHVSSSST